MRKWIQKKLEDAANGKMTRDEKAEAVIWAAIAINAGMGVAPFGINIWSFVAVNTAMTAILAKLYDQPMSKERAADLVMRTFMSAGVTWASSTLGLKFCAEFLKGAGVITMGGVTPLGMAIDATLFGAITFGLGFTTKKYFAMGQKMSKRALGREFRDQFARGKRQVNKRKSETA